MIQHLQGLKVKQAELKATHENRLERAKKRRNEYLRQIVDKATTRTKFRSISLQPKSSMTMQ